MSGDDWGALAQLIGFLCVMVGLATALLVVVSLLDEGHQVRKPPTPVEVPHFRIVTVRERVRTNLAWPTLLAIVTGLFVSLAASYFVKFFDSVQEGVLSGDLIVAGACFGAAMLVLAFALRWMGTELERDLRGVEIPSALASAMAALRRGNEELVGHQDVLRARLEIWEKVLPLYAVGRWGVAKWSAIPGDFPFDQVADLRNRLRAASDGTGASDAHHLRRAAGQAALRSSAWAFRFPYRAVWLLPAGVVLMSVTTFSWGWLIGIGAVTFGVYLLRRWYIGVRGAWCARRYRDEAAYLTVARTEWDQWCSVPSSSQPAETPSLWGRAKRLWWGSRRP